LTGIDVLERNISFQNNLYYVPEEFKTKLGNKKDEPGFDIGGKFIEGVSSGYGLKYCGKNDDCRYPLTDLKEKFRWERVG